MNDFLPKDYELPNASNGYMRFEQGDNRFRIMGSPIIGWEYWVDKDGLPTEKGAAPQQGNRPVRVPMKGTVPVVASDIVKHFWAMIVWNYKVENFQILEITQKGIQKTIKGYSSDEDWGSPINYDLVVSRTGEGIETEYEVKAKPAKPLDDEIQDLYKKVSINLEALFDGDDPFSDREKVIDIVEDDIKLEGEE